MTGSGANGPRGERVASGAWRLALRTPTLPPATRTNACLIGLVRVWVVDPATPHTDERARLLAACEALTAEGRSIAGILLTHHHADHVGAAAWLAEQLGLSIGAHERTRALLDGQVRITHELGEGDTIDGGGQSWQVLHTPGHASGHLVFWNSEERVLIAGDMVATASTVIIDPPDGEMGAYIAQLERLHALGAERLVPAHGEVVVEPDALLEQTIAHRRWREQLIADALGEGPRPLSEITEAAYPDVPRALHGLAARSALAHLLKLEREGRAWRDPAARWGRTPAGG